MLVEDRLLVLIRKKQEEENIRVIKQLLSKDPYEDYVIDDGILMKQTDTSRIIVLSTCTLMSLNELTTKDILVRKK